MVYETSKAGFAGDIIRYSEQHSLQMAMSRDDPVPIPLFTIVLTTRRYGYARTVSHSDEVMISLSQTFDAPTALIWTW